MTYDTYLTFHGKGFGRHKMEAEGEAKADADTATRRPDFRQAAAPFGVDIGPPHTISNALPTTENHQDFGTHASCARNGFSMANPKFDWRKHLGVHPAADLFPLMSEVDPAALKELADDILKNGLRADVIFWIDKNGRQLLLDGRNRLDALALAGLLEVDRKGDLVKKGGWFPRFSYHDKSDPFAMVLSLNIHRRHLTPDQKRELIAKLLKAKPAASDRQIGTMAKADGKTVAKVRGELQGRAEIPHDDKRTDTKGRKQPAKRKPVDPTVVVEWRKKKAEKPAAALKAELEAFNKSESRPEPKEPSADGAVDGDPKPELIKPEPETNPIPDAQDKAEGDRAAVDVFDQAVAILKELSAKHHRDKFIDSAHTAAEIELVGGFLCAVALCGKAAA